MFKKIALVVTILLLVLAQSHFIYAVQCGGANAFAALWKGFGVTQTAYSQFVFRTIEWWWAVPVLCMLLLTVTAYRPTPLRRLAVIFVSLAGVVALYWSVYAPALFIAL